MRSGVWIANAFVALAAVAYPRRAIEDIGANFIGIKVPKEVH